MNRNILMPVLWLVAGIILVGYGWTIDTTWIRWTVVIIGAAGIVVNGVAITRQMSSSRR